MKKSSKKLRLDIETVKTLVGDALVQVRGGRGTTSQHDTCSCEASCNEPGNVTGPIKITGRV